MFAQQRQQLGALESRIKTAASGLRADLSGLRTRLASIEAEALQPLARSEQSLMQSVGTTAKQVAALRAKVRGARGGPGALAPASQVSQIDAAESAAKAALATVARQLTVSKTSLSASAKQLCNASESTLADIDVTISSLESAALGPVSGMKLSLDRTDAQLRALVEAAAHALDVLQTEAIGKIRQFVDQIAGVIETATASLASIRVAIDGLPDAILPAIKALKALLQGIETAFKTGTQALHTALNTAKSAVDALPVASLPKPLVRPTQSGIDSALSAAMSALDSAAKAAGSQLTALSGQVQTQIDTAKSQGLAQVDTFVATISSQIAAIMPVAEAQLATLQKSIDALIAQFGAQVDAANATVLAELARLKSQASEAASALVTTTTSTSNTATKTAQQAVAACVQRLDVGVSSLATEGANAALAIDSAARVAAESAAVVIRRVAQSLP